MRCGKKIIIKIELAVTDYNFVSEMIHTFIRLFFTFWHRDNF